MSDAKTRGNYSLLHNDIFSLGLETGAIVVYMFLLRCADRETNECWPSYRTIGNAVRMSKNTVRKYVQELEDKGLICTEPTLAVKRDGRRKNSSLRYTLLPVEDAVKLREQRLRNELDAAAEQWRVEEKLAVMNRNRV